MIKIMAALCWRVPEARRSTVVALRPTDEAPSMFRFIGALIEMFPLLGAKTKSLPTLVNPTVFACACAKRLTRADSSLI